MKLHYTGTFNGEIKLCDYAEPGQPSQEIMLNTKASRVIEVSAGAGAVILTLFPQSFAQVQEVTMPEPEAAPAEEPQSGKRSR